MARALGEFTVAADDAPALADLFGQLGVPFIDAGHAVAAFGRLQEDPSSVPNREQAIRAGAEATSGQAHGAEKVADLSHRGDLSPAHLLLASSILVDVDRLIREVDVEHGAHAAAVAVS